MIRIGMSGIERHAWIVGGIGLLGAAFGWVIDAPAFYAAWLAALTAWIGWPLGSMALLLVHALTGGRWGEAVRPALLAGVGTLPLLLPALLPLVIGMPALYPWTHADIGRHLANHFYLNLPFFAGRGVAYLVVWFGLGALIPSTTDLRRIAPPGLLLLAFTYTFVAVDTTMSLDPHFTSSAYGMIAAAAAVLLALSIATLLTGTLLSSTRADADTRADLGKLLLGLSVLWAYLEFMQLLIIWQSDLESEAPWYIARSSGIWVPVVALIALAHFAVPFFLLLSDNRQRRRGVILGAAGLLVAMEVLRCWWLVLPGLNRGIGWTVMACTLAFAGCSLALAAHFQGRSVRAHQHG
jgi:hypothetical protein